jgi:hypothetical protein
MSRSVISFHTEKTSSGRGTTQYCEVRVLILQENRAAVVARACGEEARITVRVNDNSWGSGFCALHARLRLEELQKELLAEPEKEE